MHCENIQCICIPTLFLSDNIFLFYKSDLCIHPDPSKKVPQGLHILLAPITAEMLEWTEPDISLVIALSLVREPTRAGWLASCPGTGSARS